MLDKGSAAKRQRQNENRRLRNRSAKSRINTEKRKFLEAVDAKDSNEAQARFAEVIKLIDSAVNKGLYQKNTADRKKSRLHKMLNSLQGE
ncbi:MAG: 30S ribosomal protein S20 [Spirochaetales bacterium]|nr:30S ribosomal protein S20 [Spirochaetales bacterium]